MPRCCSAVSMHQPALRPPSSLSCCLFLPKTMPPHSAFHSRASRHSAPAGEYQNRTIFNYSISVRLSLCCYRRRFEPHTAENARRFAARHREPQRPVHRSSHKVRCGARIPRLEVGAPAHTMKHIQLWARAALRTHPCLSSPLLTHLSFPASLPAVNHGKPRFVHDQQHRLDL